MRIQNSICMMMVLLTGCQLTPKDTDLVFDESPIKSNGSASLNPVVSSNSNPASNSNSNANSNANVTDDIEMKLQMADRRYVFSFLTKVFDLGPGSALEKTVRGQVFMVADFGGACEPYANTNEFPDEKCNGSDFLLVSSANPMRFAHVLKTCEGILKDDTVLISLRTKIYGSGAKVLQDPDSKTIDIAYQLFFPIHPPTAQAKAALLELSSIAGSSTEKWQRVFLGLCMVPDWQVY